MNKTTWLASIAMSLTVGYGASILNGDSAAPEARATSVERTIVATADGGPVMLPALTVVVKVPAKRRNTAVLASSTTEEVTLTWTHPEIAVVVKVPAREEVPEFTWTLPELAVVVKVPAREEVPEFTWTLPELAVVVKVPEQRDAGFAMAAPTSPEARRIMIARLRYLQEVRSGAPAMSPEARWNTDRDQAIRRRELDGAVGERRMPAVRPATGTEGALSPRIWDRASRAA